MKIFKLILLLFLFSRLQLIADNIDKNEKEDPVVLIKKSNEIIYTNPQQAVFYATKAFQLLSVENRNKQKDNLIVESMMACGLAEKLLGNFDSSIKLLYDALEYVSPDDISQKGKIYLLMGVVYCSLTDYNKAIEFNDKATSIFKTTGDSASIAYSYNQRGIIHYNLDEFNIAEQFFIQSLNINRTLKLMKEIAGNLNNLSLYEGIYPQKINYINEAIIINKNLDAQWSLGENYNNLGKQHFYAKQYSKALKALSVANKIATTIGAKELICDNYEYSSWVYAAMGNHQRAYESLYKLFILNNELQSSNKLRSVEQDISNKRYLVQKKVTEKNEQDYRIELLKRNIFILLILILLLITLSLFLTKWYKRKKLLELINTRFMLEQSERQVAELRVKQQELELETAQSSLVNRRKELTAFAIFLQSRNELLDKIRELVKQGYKMNGTTLIKHLKEINLYIAQYQSMNNDSSTLLLNIEELNLDFQQRLSERHPELTQGEKSLSVLLCINLSTKEIALLTGKNPKSITMNRYRLRKSLNLSPTHNLNEYLQNI